MEQEPTTRDTEVALLVDQNPEKNKTLPEIREKHNVVDVDYQKDTEPRSVSRQIRIATAGIPDFVLLYFTLVSDQAISNGYLDHFLSLESHVHAAAGVGQIQNTLASDFVSRSDSEAGC